MADVVGGIFFALIGSGLLMNIGGVADSLSRLGRAQRKWWGPWLTAGTPQTRIAARLLGVPFVVIGIGIAVFPPS